MQPVVISLKGVSKFYKLYQANKDRLKEALHPLGKKYHREYYAIRDLNLDVRRGEILGIVGRNGCGKSTLLKLISKVLQPNKGEVRVSGKVTALLELGAGFNPEFTGRENIRFYSTILGLSIKEIEQLTPTIIEFAELGQFIDQPVKTYSSGMKSRLGFAVAVHVEPDILILDEVLSVGDAAFKRKCFAKMEEFFKAGKTVLFVSHDANSVNKLCSRAVLLHNGKVLLDASPKTVTRYYERLAYAKEQDQARVLNEIYEFLEQGKATIKDDDKSEPEQQELITSSQLKPYYIPELLSKSRLDYPSDRAEIIDPHFTTLSGQRVNVLVSGEKYLYIYQVLIKDHARNTSFGMQLKDMHGTVISAASQHYDPEKILSNTPADTKLKVSWEFNCHLLPGHYFSNAGASEIINGEPIFITRIVDAVMIKVITDEKNITRGIVNLGQTIEVKVCE